MFSDEELKKASSTDLLAVVGDKGYKYHKVSKDEYKIDGYGGLHIDARKNTWYCFSDSKGGTAIQFLMKYEGLTWVDSVKYLLNVQGIRHEEEYDRKHVEDIPRKEEKAEKEDIILPEKADKFKRLYAYLIKTRGINKAIVDYFVKKGDLYENDKGGMVFVGRDANREIKYAMIRGTNEARPFKMETRNSDKRYGFSLVNENSERLVVFEGAIDLMSYMTIMQEHDKDFLSRSPNLLSLGGVGDAALTEFLSGHDIEEITLALDNDEAGEKGVKRIEDLYRNDYRIERLKFHGKDINECLMNIHKKKLNEKEQENVIEEKIETMEQVEEYETY